MADIMPEPKRRGRPPKVRLELTDADRIAVGPSMVAAARLDLSRWLAGQAPEAQTGEPYARAIPTTRLRLKAGRIQQAWQHANGTQWRDLPAVADDAPDWEGE